MSVILEMKTESTFFLHAQLASTASLGTHKDASLARARVALAVLCVQGHKKLFVTTVLQEPVVSLYKGVFSLLMPLFSFLKEDKGSIYSG